MQPWEGPRDFQLIFELVFLPLSCPPSENKTRLCDYLPCKYFSTHEVIEAIQVEMVVMWTKKLKCK